MLDILEELHEVVQHGIGEPPPVDEIRARHRRRRRHRTLPVVSLLVASTLVVLGLSLAYAGHSHTVQPGANHNRSVPRARVADIIHVGFVTDVAFGDGSVWAPGSGILRRIDPQTDAVVASIPVPGSSDYRYVAFGGGAVWVTDSGTDRLTKIDPATNRVVATVALPPSPTGLVAGYGRVWVMVSPPDGAGEVVPVNAGNGRLGRIIRVPQAQAIAAGEGAIWLATGEAAPQGPALLRIDPRTGAARPVVGPTPMLGQILVVAAGDGAVWVAARGLARINPRTGALSYSGLGPPSSLTIGGGAVWAVYDTNNSNGGYPGIVQRVSPATGKPEGPSITVGETPVGIAVGDGAAWVASYTKGTITRIDI